MRDFAERRSRFKTIQVSLYAILISCRLCLELPLNLYENFYREHQYGFRDAGLHSVVSATIDRSRRHTDPWQILLIVLSAVFRAPRAHGGFGEQLWRSFSYARSTFIAPVYIELAL